METVQDSSAAWQVIATAVIFLIVYACVITEKLNRAVAALAGALLLVLFHVVDFTAAIERYIPWETIALFAGMMILTSLVQRTGLVPYAAAHLVRLLKAAPLRILLVLSILTAVGSALLDSVLVVLLLVPFTFSLTRMMKLNPAPYLISQIIAANIGGVATLIGSPTNMMIGTAAGFSFNEMFMHLAPVALICLVLVIILFALLYRRQLVVPAKLRTQVMAIKPHEHIRDLSLAIRSLVIYGLTIIGLILHETLHLEAAVIALTGATLLMLVGVRSHEGHGRLFETIEWPLLIFLASIYVIVGGLVETGVIGSMATGLVEIAQGNVLIASMLMLWLTGLVAATADSLPWVAAMIPLVDEALNQFRMAGSEHIRHPLWVTLALGAGLGANGTLIGAAVNVVVAGMSAKEGAALRYVQYLKVGAFVALLSLAVASIYVYTVYFLWA